MNPSRAIDLECRRCMNTPNRKVDCGSSVCKLNDGSLSRLKRIKAHCITCCPEQTIYGVKDCTGRYMDGTICVLHQYRLGHNPKLKGKRGIGHSAEFMEKLRLKRIVSEK